MKNSRLALAIPILAGLALPAPAQAPIIQNTALLAHVNLDQYTSSWSAGNWGYRTATGRYFLQTLSGTNPGGLAVIDTTNPSTPVTAVLQNINVKEVKVYQNYAYATTDGGPTRVVDLTNPSAPVLANSITQGAHTLQVDAANGRLYMNRASQSQLRVLDVASDPVNPPLITAYSIPIHDSMPKGNTVYVFGGSSDLVNILDVSALPTVTQLGQFTPGTIYCHSGDLYVTPSGQKFLLTCQEGTGGYLKIWDVTNPAAVPSTPVAQYYTSLSLSVHNVLVKGAYAYVAYYKDGLRVLDLSIPSAPVEVGIFDPNATNATGSTFSGQWDAYPYHDAIYLDEMDNAGGSIQGGWIVDFYPAFGTGCPGTGGVVPTPWWSYGPPSPGNAEFALRLKNARSNAPALLLLGLSNTTWNAIPLPLDLTAFGVNGCTLYTSTDLLFSTATNASGEASIALPVPPGVSGVLWCQWVVSDPGAPNPLQLALSKAGKLILQ